MRSNRSIQSNPISIDLDDLVDWIGFVIFKTDIIGSNDGFAYENLIQSNLVRFMLILLL